MTQFTLRDLAALVGGQLHGDPATTITGAATLRDARPGDITLADSPRQAAALHKCPATAVLVPADFRPEGIARIAVENVHAAFARIVEQFRPLRQATACGVSAAAHVSPAARLEAGVVVHPGAVIGDDVTIGPGTVVHSGVQILAGCRIGENVTLFPNAVLYENTMLGNRVIVHAGAVLGAYGFGYATVHGRHLLSAQLGFVAVEDDVEIGAGTTIDRGTYGATTIGEGTKIDNLVQIGHNCRIGRHNLICAQVGVAGSCVTGDYVVMAGQVGLRDHIQLGDRARIGAKGGVMHDIPEGASFVGIPATPEREQMIKQAALAKLPEMRKELKTLAKKVACLEAESRREAA